MKVFLKWLCLFVVVMGLALAGASATPAHARTLTYRRDRRKFFSYSPKKSLLHHCSLCLLLIFLLPSASLAKLAQASPSTTHKRLNAIKEINYYPANHAWTKMWLDFHPEEINNDFAKLHLSGFNTVRIILQAEMQVFDYPLPTAVEQNTLSQVIALAAQHSLKVHLTLFDAWNQYQDLEGSKQWASTIVKPYAADPRINIVELQNEMTVTPDSLTWAQTMIPYLQSIDGAIPVTVSESGFLRMQKLVDGLHSVRPDFYDYHLYEYQGQMYTTLKHVKELIHGAPLFLGESGYSTYAQNPHGFSGTPQNTPAQEAQQEYFYRMLVSATRALELPFPSFWVFSDFSAGAFPGPLQLATIQEAYFGIFRLDGSEKPAADLVASLLAGNTVDTSFNNSFEQDDGQGLPTLWRIAQTASPDAPAHFARDTTVAHSGQASVSISSSAASSPASFFLNPLQYVVPEKTYIASVWTRGLSTTGSDSLSLVWLDEHGKALSDVDSSLFPRGTYDWQQKTLIAEAPSEAAAVEIHLNSQGNSGIVWFDDVLFRLDS